MRGGCEAAKVLVYPAASPSVITIPHAPPSRSMCKDLPCRVAFNDVSGKPYKVPCEDPKSLAPRTLNISGS